MRFCRNWLHGGHLVSLGRRSMAWLDAQLLRGTGLALPAVETRWLKRQMPAFLGWQGLAGIGLLAGCAAFHVSTMMPAQEKLDSTRYRLLARQEQDRHAVRPAVASRASAAEQVASFYRMFPQDRNLPQSMEKIFVAAESHGLALQQGDYKVSRSKDGGVVGFQMNFPVKGDYPQIRKYLVTLLADNPTLSLQQVQFKRKRVGEATVEANVSLMLFMLEQRS